MKTRQIKLTLEVDDNVHCSLFNLLGSNNLKIENVLNDFLCDLVYEENQEINTWFANNYKQNK